MRRGLVIALAIGGLLAAGAAPAQTLSDMRMELAELQAQIQSLEAELSGDGAGQPLAGQSALERLASVEAALQRLTAGSERLEFRITRIVGDGTAQIAQLERRLCALEEGCDPEALPPVARLGDDPEPPAPVPSPEVNSLLGSEEQDYLAAMQELESGAYERALSNLMGFRTRYPTSPHTGQVEILIGRAYEGTGALTDAAKAYLGAFSADPQGDEAPEALTRLGLALSKLDQSDEACTTLREVASRFATSPFVQQAQAAMDEMSCPSN